MNVLKAALRVTFLVAIVAVSGCEPGSKLNFEKTFDLKAENSSQSFIISAPKQDQKVKVEVTSKEPVEVVVVLVKDAEGKGKPIDTKKKITNEAFEVSIPKGEEFQVTVSSMKDTQVTLKVNNVK